MDLSEDTRLLVEEKLRNLGKFQLGILAARVEIKKIAPGHHFKGDIYKVRVNLELPGVSEKIIRSAATKESLGSALKVVRQDLTRSLQKQKDKGKAEEKRGARKLKKKIHVSAGAKLPADIIKGGRNLEEGA